MSDCAVDERVLTERLEAVGRWLLNRGFATAYLMITRLGLPTFAGVGTAGVGTRGGRILFQFDPAFWSRLTLEELVGVLAHEAMHVLLRHVAGPGERDPVRARCWNLACDAVVNDRLQRDYAGIRLPEGPITGQLLVGHDCHDRTAEEVLDELVGRINQDPSIAAVVADLETLDSHEAWAVRDPGLPATLPASLERGVDEILQRTCAVDRAAARAWASGRGSGHERTVQARATPIDPMAIIESIIVRSGRPTPRWVPPSPKLWPLYPRLLLPRWEDGCEVRILFAIDASGSIDDEWLSVFAAVPRAVGSRARIEIVSFDTEVYPFERHGAGLRGGGGTRFQAVADYVASLARHPDGVVVLTDGGSSRPAVRLPGRWLWLLTEGGSDTEIEGIGRVMRVRPR